MSRFWSQRFRIRRGIWAATILGIVLSNCAVAALLAGLPVAKLTLCIIVTAALLSVLSTALIIGFDRELGALALGLFIGGGAIERGITELPEIALWMPVLAFTVLGLRVSLLLEAIRADRRLPPARQASRTA